ncbi:hypothetical protein OOZ15_05320 [Galbibacter sp. EGI 63066]|uniref:hypothetical protein n=1 Tax=Galbibacter sp. EGI 63066 TaxID=2993559 RepID=UPI002248DBF4|nr:hypothetical protein [Galbibacter sp. EGI 63066]MCX2679356.1 hypothetical protein [Galbibacter sp. EGI 63066]
MKNKTKNIILAIGLVLVLFISYQYAISKTIALRNTYKELSKENVLFQNIPRQQYMLNKQNQHLDSLLNKYQIGGTSLQNNLLKSLNQNVDSLNLKLVEFNDAHIFKRNDLTVNSHQFVVEGGFNSILKLVYNLEQKTKFGEVSHINFEKKKNFRTRKEFLQAFVIVQNYK